MFPGLNQQLRSSGISPADTWKVRNSSFLGGRFEDDEKSPNLGRERIGEEEALVERTNEPPNER